MAVEFEGKQYKFEPIFRVPQKINYELNRNDKKNLEYLKTFKFKR